MTEEFADLGEITICHETFGDPADPALLLIMGLATQMIAWHDDFCRELVDAGFHVIRFDNRDCGRSTHMDGAPTPSIGQLIRRDKKAASYTLADMADDTAGVLTHLEIERAHVVGASMGGMIAQTLAARHPERVLSLVSIMSNTGGRIDGQPALTIYPALLKLAPKEREAYADHIVKLFDTVGSTGFDRDTDAVRDIALRSYDRSYDPRGSARQMIAIGAYGNRRAELRRVTAPTLVVHGTADKLVRPSGGRATANAIPGARLMEIDGMGHDMPRGTWPRIVGGIVENARRAGFEAPAPAARGA